MHRVRVVGAVLAAATSFAAGTAALALSANTASAATLSGRWYAQAPYVMPLANNTPDLPAVMSATGEKAFMLAFILANGSACSAAWDGTAPVSSDTQVANLIAGVRGAGGDVSVSIGGYGGTKLGQVCDGAASTAGAYQAVINKYALKAIDLDLEEPEYENLTAVNNEVGAAQILQRDNPGLYVSITLPGTATGTGYFGQNVLNTAKSLGFTPDNWTIMPFDGGFNGAGSQQSALQAFNGLLTTTFGWSAANAWAHEGISQMNGRSDTGETFTQADFASNVAFAGSVGLGRFTNWAVNRDRQCPGGANTTVSATCSSIVQNDWDFTRYGVQFATAAGAGGGTTTISGNVLSGPGGKCVDVAGDDNGGNGSAVQLWDCQSGAVDQHWTAVNGALRTLNRCLDVTGNGTGIGTQLELWDCTGGGAQQWVPQADGSLKNPQSGRCMDSPNSSTANGARLQIWDCNGTGAQKFSIAGGTGAAGSTGGTVTGTIQAEAFSAQSGTQTEPTTDTGGGQNVGYAGNGDWLQFSNVDFGTAGLHTFNARVASGAAAGVSGSVEVHLDSLSNPAVGSLSLSSTGGWQSWQTVPAAISTTTGTHTVFVKFVTGSGQDFVNLNWLSFS